MKIPAFFFLLLLIPLVTSAKDCQPDHPDRPLLVGQWNWLYTEDVHSGNSTPASLGVVRILDLRGDGTYDLFEDGLSIEAGTWCLRPCQSNIQDNCTNSRVVLNLDFGCLPGGLPTCEWDYAFCSASNCTYFLPDLTEGLRIDAIDHSGVIKLYEPQTPVPNRLESWSTLKARH